jgi:hypothetical protein
MWEARSRAGSVMPVRGTAPSPVIQQRGAKIVLAHALHGHPLDLGGAGQAGGRSFELGEWRGGKAARETPGSIERVIEPNEGREHVSTHAWAGNLDAGAYFGGDASVVHREEPRSGRAGAGDPYLGGRGGGRVADPGAIDAAL